MFGPARGPRGEVARDRERRLRLARARSFVGRQGRQCAEPLPPWCTAVLGGPPPRIWRGWRASAPPEGQQRQRLATSWRRRCSSAEGRQRVHRRAARGPAGRGCQDRGADPLPTRLHPPPAPTRRRAASIASASSEPRSATSRAARPPKAANQRAEAAPAQHGAIFGRRRRRAPWVKRGILRHGAMPCETTSCMAAAPATPLRPAAAATPAARAGRAAGLRRPAADRPRRRGRSPAEPRRVLARRGGAAGCRARSTRCPAAPRWRRSELRAALEATRALPAEAKAARRAARLGLKRPV